MFYQICNKDGKILAGSAKKPKWLERSALFFKEGGVKSFIANAKKYHPEEGFKTEEGTILYDDMVVVEAHITYQNPTPIRQIAKL